MKKKKIKDIEVCKSKITVEETMRAYELYDENGYSIRAKVKSNGTITLYRADGKSEGFVFEDSDPETVEAIGRLIVRAAELARREK